MANIKNFSDKNLLFHIFSKSPVNETQTLEQVKNKSGHTLTTDDIFGEEIPACFFSNEQKDKTRFKARKNDLCKIGNNNYYFYNGSEWKERSSWNDGEVFFNQHSAYLNNGEDCLDSEKIPSAIIKYYKERDAVFLKDDNNNYATGNKLTVRVKDENDDFIPQFLSATDIFVGGVPSVGYNPIVTKNGTTMKEDASVGDDEAKYIANNYAGIIQFPIEYSGTEIATGIKVSVWRYIGKTLTEVLKNFSTSGFNYEVVSSINDRPEASENLKGWIYFVPNLYDDEEGIDYYEEYICVNKNDVWKWELIGSTKLVTGFTDDSTIGTHISDQYTTAVKGSIEDGKIQLYTRIASSTHRGVSYLYNKTANTLGSATDAAVTESTIKSVYDKITSNQVSSVNGYSGAITLKAGGNTANLTANTNSDSASNLWGLNVDNRSGYQYVIDGFIGDNDVYGNIGTDYAETASLPSAATKVIGNFVYDSDGNVIDTIRAERMVSSFYGKTATGLTEWVADMHNLKNGYYCFAATNNLTTFIGDLSSLTIGTGMFYGCTALETFIGHLSSLDNAECMFTANTDYGSKLNAESVEYILYSIPTYTYGTHKLGLGIHVDAVATFNKITGAQLTATNGSSLENVSYKGWTISVYVRR